MRAAFSPPQKAGSKKHLVIIAICFILVLLAALLLPFWVKISKRPSVSSINPSIGDPGSRMVIRGANFGNERGDGKVEFDGVSPSSSAYVSWHDDYIELLIPVFVESSLIRVVNSYGKSNSMIFMSSNLLPATPAGKGSVSLGPSIDSLSSNSGSIGALLVIKGLNFGANKGDSSVRFSWQGESGVYAPGEEAQKNYVSPSETIGEYESWTDKEIKLRIPDGATSGGISVVTERGSSPVQYFQIVDSPGTKLYAGRKTYALSSFVSISRVNARVPSALYLWVPSPLESPYQKSIKEPVRSSEALFPDYKGLSVYRIVDPKADSVYTISQDFVIQVYGVASDIKADKIKTAPAPLPRFYSALTAPDAFVTSDAPEIQAFSKKLAAKEKNPYKLAKLALDTIISSIVYDPSYISYSLPLAIESGKADAWDMALLYTAVLRALGIPALPVAGVVMDDKRKAWPHFWTEFYIYGIGWIPVDPVLAGGASIGSFVAPFSDSSLYFGNMDDRHIAFSRGLSQVDRITPDGKSVSASRRYSFQSIFEEAAGELESYTSFWSDIEITGVY